MFEKINPDLADKWLHVPGDWRRPSVKNEYTILWESQRSYGQVWPRPGLSEVPSFYQLEEYYTHAPRLMPGPLAHNPFQRLQTKISWLADKGVEPDREWWLKVLGDQKKRRILEIGCGNGANLTTLKALGHSVVGVEPDPEARAVARFAGHQVHEGTAEDLPREMLGGLFDVVIFMHVLEHCLDPFEAVRNAIGVLKDGGTVIAEVPNNECKGAERFGAAWHWLDVPRHLNFFTAHSLEELFGSVGMIVEDVMFRGYCRQFSSDWKEAQRKIAQNLGLSDQERPRGRDYWVYLAETIWATERKKYDSVRLVGRLE